MEPVLFLTPVSYFLIQVTTAWSQPKISAVVMSNDARIINFSGSSFHYEADDVETKEKRFLSEVLTNNITTIFFQISNRGNPVIRSFFQNKMEKNRI